MTQQLRQASEIEPQEASGTSEIADQDAVTSAPIKHTGRQGYLPITTNTFDRVFISVVCFVAIHLVWMRLFEVFLPLWIATLLSLILAVAIIRWG